MGSLREPPGGTSPGHPILAPEKVLDLQTRENNVLFSLQACGDSSAARSLYLGTNLSLADFLRGRERGL